MGGWEVVELGWGVGWSEREGKARDCRDILEAFGSFFWLTVRILLTSLSS
jgi:hypothetical protein